MIATECLDAICTVSTRDATLLYACVLEAQQSGDQVQMVISLQRVLIKYDYSAPDEVHLPALLRYDIKFGACWAVTNSSSLAARLLVRESESSESKIKDCASDICSLFEGGESL